MKKIVSELQPAYEYVVLDDGTAQITQYTGQDAELTIPMVLDGYARPYSTNVSPLAYRADST